MYRTSRKNYIFYGAILATIIICFFGHTQSSAAKKEPLVLDEDSWVQLMKGEWMVDFYAPWCPACKRLEPDWKTFATWVDDLNIGVASADVTKNPGLTGRFMVSGLPTIYHVKDGVFRLYSGPRDYTSLISFVEEQKWKNVEPVSRWWAPDTLQMSFVAYSFRISMALRAVHNILVEDYGFPYYVSYLMFTVGTVILGTILGLIIVFIIDQFCPSRSPTDATSATIAEKKKKTDNDKDSDLEDSKPDTTKTEAKKEAGGSKVRRRAG